MGRPREAQVRRDERDCPVHGRTTFAMGVCHGGGTSWTCMACRNETSREYHRQVREGTRTVQPRKVEREARPICSGCHEMLPLTGICDNCD